MVQNRKSSPRPFPWGPAVKLFMMLVAGNFALAGCNAGREPPRAPQPGSEGTSSTLAEPSDPRDWDAMLPIGRPTGVKSSALVLPELPSPLTGEWMKQQAHRVAEELASRFPKDVFALHVLAQVHRLSGDTDRALEIWESCLTLKEDFLPAYEEMVQVFVRRGQHEAAERVARQGLRFHPAAVSLRNVLASTLLEQGRIDDAIAVVLAGRALDSVSPEGLFILAQAYQRKQEHERACRVLEEALRLRPDFTQAHYALSLSLSRLGKQEEAAKHRTIFQDLKARDQQNNAAILRVESDEFVRRTVAGVFHQAGVIFSNHEDTQRAEQCWLMAAALSPTEVAPRQALVVLYQRNGQPGQALQVLEDLIPLQPENPEHYVAQGVCHLQLGNATEAISAFQKALKMAPDSAAACAGLAQALIQSEGNREEALYWAKKAVELNPRPEYWVVLGVAYARLNDGSAAAEAARKALVLNPSYAPAKKLAQLLQHGS